MSEAVAPGQLSELYREGVDLMEEIHDTHVEGYDTDTLLEDYRDWKERWDAVRR